MYDVNKIILLGRLGNDPIQRETKKGVPVVHFSLATSRRVKDETDSLDRVEETQWHRIVVWGKQAEACGSFLKKGCRVYVEGSVRSHFYDGKDGAKRTAFEVHAEKVNFLSGKARKSSQESRETQEMAAS